MRGCDLTYSTGESAHDKRVRAGAIAKVTYTLKQLTVGDTRSGEENIFGRDEVLYGQDFVEVISGFMSTAQLVFIAGIHLPLDLTPHGAQGTGCDHTFGCAAHSQQDIHA